jgi:outer membrane protein TolC
MLKRSLGLVVFSLLTVTASLFAQQRLTLDQCRQMAIENNKLLKSASERERMAHYQKIEALMQFFPKVSASGMYMHFNENLHLLKKSLIPTGIPLPPILGGITIPIDENIRNSIYEIGAIDLSNIWVAGISLTQPIFAGGKIVAYNDMAAYARDLAEKLHDIKMTDVIVEVDEAYWQVVSLTDKLKLADAYVNLLRKMDYDMESLETEGMVTKSDRLSVSVKLNEAAVTQTKAENGLSLAKMLLCQICGMPIDTSINLTDEIVSPHYSAIDVKPYDIEQAIDNRNEMKSLELVVKIAKQQKKIAFSEYLPTIGLTTGYSWMRPNLQDGLQDRFAGSWNIGVAVAVPLNFISSSAKYNMSKAQVSMKKYEMEDAREKMRLQINQSEFKLIEANKKMSAAMKNAEHATENLRYAKEGFEEGVVSTSDVLAAHTAWLMAQSEKIDAMIDQRLCKIYLNRSLGRDLTNTNKE